MRHFPLAEPFTTTVVSLPPGVTNTSRPRRLIATSRCPQRHPTSGARALRPAVDLPPVAPRANPHLPATAPTQEKPEILSQPPSALPRGWTRQRFPAILAADAASAAPVVRRPRTWRLTTKSPGPSLSSAALPDSSGPSSPAPPCGGMMLFLLYTLSSWRCRVNRQICAVPDSHQHPPDGHVARGPLLSVVKVAARRYGSPGSAS